MSYNQNQAEVLQHMFAKETVQQSYKLSQCLTN